jgi:hypothetical protein
MRRLALVFAALFAASAAQAGEFYVTPAYTTVVRGQDTVELTLSYSPYGGAQAAEVDLPINLSQLGWTQVVPGASNSTRQVFCQLSGGAVRALVFSASGQALPSGNIALCKLRVRPHPRAMPGYHWLSPVNFLAVDSGGNPVFTRAYSSRLTVE